VLSRHDLDQVYRRMVALADRTKHISDEDLFDIAEAVTGRARPKEAREAVLQEAGYGFGV